VASPSQRPFLSALRSFRRRARAKAIAAWPEGNEESNLLSGPLKPLPSRGLLLQVNNLRAWTVMRAFKVARAASSFSGWERARARRERSPTNLAFSLFPLERGKRRHLSSIVARRRKAPKATATSSALASGSNSRRLLSI